MARQHDRQQSRGRAPAVQTARTGGVAAVPTPARGRWWRDWAFAVGLIVLTLAAYRPALTNAFIWDDDDYVFQNPHLRDPGGLTRIWFEKAESPQYYPLVFSTFWVETRLWGRDAAGEFVATGFHITNVVLHGLNAVLVWLVLRRVGFDGRLAFLPGDPIGPRPRGGVGWLALLAGVMFALHPLHVESVAWVTERKNVLSGLFFLLAALAFLTFEDRAEGRRPGSEARAAQAGGARAFLGAAAGWYAIGFGLFGLGLLSKTVIASLPIALLVLRWWRGRRLSWWFVASMAPLLMVGAVMGRMTAQHEMTFVLDHTGVSGADLPEPWQLSFADRVVSAGRALWFYAGKLVWPEPLVFNYPRWEPDGSSLAWWLWPASAAAVGAGLLAWWLWNRRRGVGWGRGPLAAGVFFAVSLFPALGFVNVAPMRYSFVADHFCYMGSLGMIAGAIGSAAWAVGRLSRPAAAARVAGFASAMGVAAAMVLGVLTWNQAGLYRSLEALYRDTLGHYPQSNLANQNLGVILRRRGDLAEAEKLFNTVLANWSHWREPRSLALSNLGNIRTDQGRHDDAEKLFRESLEIVPRRIETRYNLANSLLLQRRYAEAAAEYDRVIDLAPDHAKAWLNKGVSLANDNRPTEARAAFERAAAVQADPVVTPERKLSREDRAALELQFGAIEKAANRPDQAKARLRRAIEINPGLIEARLSLADVLAATGDRAAASKELIAAARAAPGDGGLIFRLATMLRQLGDYAGEMVVLREGLKARPGDPLMSLRLAELLAACPIDAARSGPEAVELAEAAVRIAGRGEPLAMAALAAAYAEVGRFAEAVAAQAEAVRVAETSGNEQFSSEMRLRLAELRAGRPIRLR